MMCKERKGIVYLNISLYIPALLNVKRIESRSESVRESVMETKMAIIIAIWYFIAKRGDEPPSICPVIIPGSETIPIVAIVAIVGWIADFIAVVKNGINASI